jgi:hypothetical protein
MPSKGKIGITMSKDHVFSNGINQNAIFMVLMLRNLGYDCDILSYDSEHTQIVFENMPVKLISINPSKFSVMDYIALISVTTAIEGPIYDRCRLGGIPVIGYVCTNGLCMSIERVATDRTKDIAIGNEIPIDIAWVLDAFPFMKTQTEILRNTKAYSVPHLWNSSVVEYYCKTINKKDPSLMIYNPLNHIQKKITLLITEPNINFVKTAVVPLMAAEKLHRINPELIDEVFVFSYPTDSKTLETIVSNISIGKKVRKFTRQLISEIMLHFNTRDSVPIFVCNQIYTPLNYSYYETLYYGFPFVHNSPLLKDFGHYYPDLDIDMCSIQIMKAFQSHADIETRLVKQREYLELIDPTNAKCLEQWKPIMSKSGI